MYRKPWQVQKHFIISKIGETKTHKKIFCTSNVTHLPLQRKSSVSLNPQVNHLFRPRDNAHPGGVWCLCCFPWRAGTALYSTATWYRRLFCLVVAPKGCFTCWRKCQPCPPPHPRALSCPSTHQCKCGTLLHCGWGKSYEKKGREKKKKLPKSPFSFPGLGCVFFFLSSSVWCGLCFKWKMYRSCRRCRWRMGELSIALQSSLLPYAISAEGSCFTC